MNSNSEEVEGGKSSGGKGSSILWRNIWAFLFVFLAIEAVLIAALIKTRREINVTNPVIRSGEAAKASKPIIDIVETYLSESWTYEETTLHFYAGSRPSMSSKAYLDAVKGDFGFISEMLGAENVETPRDIFIFGVELDPLLLENSLEQGWVSGEKLFLPAARNAALPIMAYILSNADAEYDPKILRIVAPFLAGYLDFINDYPYESFYETVESEWQFETKLALPLANAVLDDLALGTRPAPIEASAETVLYGEGATATILRRAFLRYLLSLRGWEGMAELLEIGEGEEEAFSKVFGKPVGDLLLDFEEFLSEGEEDDFLVTRAKIAALDLGALRYSIPYQLLGDAEWALKREVRRFRLSARDLADRNYELGAIYVKRFLDYPDPTTREAGNLARSAEQILLSRAASYDEAGKLRNRWLVGRIYERRGEYEDADRFYEAGLSHQQLREYYLPEYAEILVARRNFQRAADVLAEHLERTPNDLPALFSRMSCLARMGDSEGASAIAEIVLSHPLILEGMYPEWALAAKHNLAEPAPLEDAPDEDGEDADGDETPAGED